MTYPKSSNRSSEITLERLDSEGTFGRIYRARYTATSHIVAVKIVAESEDVRNEIHFLSKCCSSFCVGYFGSFVCDSDGDGETNAGGLNRWVVTDYCGGGFVSDYLTSSTKRKKRSSCRGRSKSGTDVGNGDCSDVYAMPIECIRAVCAGIVLGLEYLHSIDICHRDIRCSNVLLSNAGYVKLTGFGLSAELDDETKKCKDIVGSPPWMAPEVAEGIPYDGQADIWSLGITAIELMEGVPPLISTTAKTASQDQTITSLFSIIPTKSMAEFIDCCCRNKPNDRSDAKTLGLHNTFVREEVTKGRMGSRLFPWHLLSEPQDDEN